MVIPWEICVTYMVRDNEIGDRGHGNSKLRFRLKLCANEYRLL